MRDKSIEMIVVGVTLISLTLFLGLVSVQPLSVNVEAQIESPLSARSIYAQSLSPVPETDTNDLVILSHRFDESRFSSEIIGEIMNNDTTKSYDKYDMNVIANFRDPTGMLLTSESGFIDAERLRPGQSSAFNVFLFGDDIADRASTYDLIINDDRLVIAAPLNGEYSDDGDNDNNGDGSGSGSRSSEALEDLEDLINGNDNDNGDSNQVPECNENERVNPSTGECDSINCIPEYTIPCGGDVNMLPKEDESTEEDDGYVYPDDATDEEKKQIDEQEQQEWEDAGRPGDESDNDEKDETEPDGSEE